MSDSSATPNPAPTVSVTAGELIAQAKVQMWRAWADYTYWQRRVNRLEGEQDEEFRRLYDTPAAPSQP